MMSRSTAGRALVVVSVVWLAFIFVAYQLSFNAAGCSFVFLLLWGFCLLVYVSKVMRDQRIVETSHLVSRPHDDGPPPMMTPGSDVLRLPPPLPPTS
jgi:hypothetical protein